MRPSAGRPRSARSRPRTRKRCGSTRATFSAMRTPSRAPWIPRPPGPRAARAGARTPRRSPPRRPRPSMRAMPRLAAAFAILLVAGACGGGAPMATASSAPAASATAAATLKPVTVRFGQVGGISDGGIYLADAKGFFKAQGITLESVAFQSAANMIAPLGTGELQAGGGAPSAGLYNAIDRGIQMRIVADKGSLLPGEQTAVILFSEKFAQDKDAATRFMTGYLQGVRLYNDAFDKKDPAKRAEVVQILATATKLDAALIERLVMPGLHPDGKVNADSLNASQQYFVAKGSQQKAVDMAKVVDLSFVDAAVKQLGAYR